MYTLGISVFIEQMPQGQSNGIGGEENTTMGSLEGDMSQGITWICLPTNYKILIAFILVYICFFTMACLFN